MRRFWFVAILGAGLAGGISTQMIIRAQPVIDTPVLCRESKGKRKRSRFEVRGW
jgi:hypothetical protein